MKQLVGLLALAALGGCVETVKFSSLAPTTSSVRDALMAEGALRHPMTRHVVEGHPEFARRLSFCTEGRSIEVYAVRQTNDGLCGIPLRPAASTGDQPVELCWRFDHLSAIGKPRDATTFGYYPVRSPLKCSPDQ